MFFKVMQDDEICKELIERLLKIKIEHIERPVLQKEIRPYYQSKGVKLDVYLKDSSHIYDVVIRAVLNYIMNQEASDSFTERIDQFVNRVKADEEARDEYMIESLAIQDSKREGRKEGIAEGRQEKAVETARNLLKMNVLTLEQISQAQGLPLEEVQKLAEEIVQTTA